MNFLDKNAYYSRRGLTVESIEILRNRVDLIADLFILYRFFSSNVKTRDRRQGNYLEENC